MQIGAARFHEPREVKRSVLANHNNSDLLHSPLHPKEGMLALSPPLQSSLRTPLGSTYFSQANVAMYSLLGGLLDDLRQVEVSFGLNDFQVQVCNSSEASLGLYYSTSYLPHQACFRNSRRRLRATVAQKLLKALLASTQRGTNGWWQTKQTKHNYV